MTPHHTPPDAPDARIPAEMEATIREDHAKRYRAIEAAGDFLRKAFPTAYDQAVNLEASLKELFCGDIEDILKRTILQIDEPPSKHEQIDELLDERDQLTAQVDAVERAKNSLPDGVGEMLEVTMAPTMRARLREIETRLNSLTSFYASAPPDAVES
jgi:hypothetical protein